MKDGTKIEDTVAFTINVPTGLYGKFKSQCDSVNKPMEHVLLAYIKSLANEDVYSKSGH